MGQSVAAIAYGVLLDERLKRLVTKTLQDPKYGEWLGFEDEGMNCGPNAGDPMMGRFDVLGFAVAIAGDNAEHPGARIMYPMPAIPMDDTAGLERIIGTEAIAEGKRKWAKLEGVAKSKGVDLPEPGYIFTTVETG